MTNLVNLRIHVQLQFHDKIIEKVRVRRARNMQIYLITY
jgi:hypothetical protein